MKKLISTPIPSLPFHSEMTCRDYFSGLKKDSVHYFFIQFVLKNKVIPRKMQAISDSKELLKKSRTLYSEIMTASPTSTTFTHLDCEPLLMHLFLIQKIISPETYIHYSNFLCTLKHTSFSERLQDQAGECLEPFKNATFYTAKLSDFITLIQDLMLENPLHDSKPIQHSDWETIKSQYLIEDETDFRDYDYWNKLFQILPSLSQQLQLNRTSLLEVLSQTTPDQQLVIVLRLHKGFPQDLIDTFSIDSLTFLTQDTRDVTASSSLVQFHPLLIQNLIHAACSSAAPISLAPVLGRYSDETAITLSINDHFHPVSVWSSFIASNLYHAHDGLPGGLFTTLHDQCHAMTKQLIPKVFRDYLLKIGLSLKESDTEKRGLSSIPLSTIFEYEFFNFIELFNHDNHPFESAFNHSDAFHDLSHEFKIGLPKLQKTSKKNLLELALYSLFITLKNENPSVPISDELTLLIDYYRETSLAVTYPYPQS